MDKHTPGPWHVGERNAILGTYIRDANGFCVAVANTPNNQRAYYIDETANARLISAAPDLLAGAAEAVAAWDMEEDTPEHNHEDRLEAAIAMLRAAIRKAGGD